MLPSPIKPIFMWLPRCCCQAVGRAVHAVRGGAVRRSGAAPTMFLVLPPLCGSPARGRKGCSRGRAFARRSQRGRCSYRPLWEPRPRGEWRAARARSVVLEVRLALLDEGLHALGLVGGGEDRVEHPTLEAHAFGQTGLEYAVDAFLGHHHARERLACNDLGGFQGFFQQLSTGKILATRPACSASRASIWRPVRHISMALALPMARVRRWVPPIPGSTPRLISGWPKRALSAA